MGTFFSAYWHSDFFGKLIFLSLFSLSILTWIFLLNKFYLFTQVRRFSLLFQSALTKHKNSLLTFTIDDLPKNTSKLLPHPYAHIYVAIKDSTKELLEKNASYGSKQSRAPSLSRSDIDLIASHAETMILRQKEYLETNFYFLSTAVTLAPFLGLLGTVWGILITLSALGNGAAIAGNASVLSGISTALATTVLGLVIAIPAMIGNNFLRNTSRKYAGEMLNFSQFILSTIELHYRKIDTE